MMSILGTVRKKTYPSLLQYTRIKIVSKIHLYSLLLIYFTLFYLRLWDILYFQYMIVQLITITCTVRQWKLTCKFSLFVQ